ETGSTAATLNFANITSPGETTLQTTSAGPPAPAGFQVGDPPITYELSTTAVFAGAIGVCFDYTGISFIDESLLKLFHYENNTWNDVTTSLDINNDLICGNVTSLSPFGLFQEPALALAAITGSQRVSIGQEASITGDLYSGGDLSLAQGKAGQPGQVAGSLAAVGDIGIAQYNHIAGDVEAGGRVKLSGKKQGAVTIDGTVTSQAAVRSIALPPVSLPVDTKKAPDITVKKKKMRDWAPNSTANPAYGVLKVEQDAQVTMHSGTYYFKRLDLGPGSTLTIQLHNGNPVTVAVAEVFRLGQGGKVVIQGGDASQVLFEVAGAYPQRKNDDEDEPEQDDEDERASLIGRLSQFAGTLYMPQGRITANERAKVNGALIGRRVRLGKQVAFTGNVASHLDLRRAPPATAKPVAQEAALPSHLMLEPNFPNPFNPETAIRFALPQAGMVRLEVYNVLGQKVRTLLTGYAQAGEQVVPWNGQDESGQVVSSGVYFCRLQAGEVVQARRMLLLK
ncbi:MAG: T9SS type A sorting domain-containing protein, partial [Candidatus Latescibacteria bacterium]|nr:T9SS type A sorting domain-containing protein [Candidatus Latescibacterota bacterium]